MSQRRKREDVFPDALHKILGRCWQLASDGSLFCSGSSTTTPTFRRSFACSAAFFIVQNVRVFTLTSAQEEVRSSPMSVCCTDIITENTLNELGHLRTSYMRGSSSGSYWNSFVNDTKVKHQYYILRIMSLIESVAYLRLCP